MTNATPVPPPVLWAQCKEHVFLTFSIESKDPNIKIEKDSVYFKGTNAQDNKVHEVTIPLFDTVNAETSAFVNRGRCIEMILRKEKIDGPYWPSLTKDKKKPHYLKMDFNKWTDEDDVEGKDGNGSEDAMGYEEILQSMVGSGAGGGDLGAAKPSFDDLEEDSDDENLPELE